MFADDISSLETLLQAGIKPSHQRVSIYDNLRSRKDHPTAEMVYLSLSPDMPTLSRTTVYNTLRLFCDKGIAGMIPSGESEMRFDAAVIFHPHFKCNRCGGIFDLPADDKCCDDLIAGLKHSDYSIESVQLLLCGACPECC